MSKLKKAGLLLGAAATAAYFSNKDNRAKLKNLITANTSKLKELDEIAQPSDIQESKMVAEGSVGSIQYFDKLRDRGFKGTSHKPITDEEE